jgi:predicted GTPase
MPDSKNVNNAVDRNEGILKTVSNLIDTFPDFIPGKQDISEKLNNLRDSIRGLRSPRIIVIGRSRSGKSSLINAICGLKVAEVSDVYPQTGEAEWISYHYGSGESDILEILDTRGFQEAQPPQGKHTATTPYKSIKKAIEQKSPDIILFICKATEVFVAVDKDIELCKLIVTDIRRKQNRSIPIIGVLTKCDELMPPSWFPTDNERKHENLQKTSVGFERLLRTDQELASYIKGVIPTVTYAEYEDGVNGLILSYEDRRWNIDKLVNTMIQYVPSETRGSLARMAHLADCQLAVARTIVTACATVNAAISANPLPGAAIPAVASIQLFMVMYIAWLSGRNFSEESLKDFTVTLGVGAGANAGMIGIADIALKFVPGVGSILAVGAAAIATQGLGDAAIAYFLNNGKV